MSRRPGARSLAVAAVVVAALASGCGGTAEPLSSAPRGLVAVWGMPGRIDGTFVQPRVIERMPGGEVVVIDRSGRVQFLDAGGRFRSKFTLENVQRGYPTGAAVTPDGRLWIAETHSYRVGVYTMEGRELMSIGGEGKEDGRFVYVTDVAVSPSGDEVYASDFGGPDRVQVFDAAGNYKRTLGQSGSGPGEWKRAQALAVAADGSIFVADSCNDRIQKISPDGKVLGVYGSAGAGPGELRYPYDIAIGPDGLVYIAEYGNCRVQRMTQDGRFCGYWGRPGSRPGELAQPWAVTLDAEGRLYILDTNNTRVVVLDTALAEWSGGSGDSPRA